MKVCNNPDGCECAAFNQSYCKFWSVPKKKKAGGLKKTKLKPRSEKMKAEGEIYSKLRVLFLKKYPTCQIKTKGCMKISTDVHHVEKRGKNLNNTGTWLSVCRNCHQSVHDNPNWGRENGFLV